MQIGEEEVLTRVVAVQQDAAFAQRQQVRRDAALPRALAERLVIAADRGIGEAEVIHQDSDDVGPDLASGERDLLGGRRTLHRLA